MHVRIRAWWRRWCWRRTAGVKAKLSSAAAPTAATTTTTTTTTHRHTHAHTHRSTYPCARARARTRGAAAQAVLEAYGGVMAKLPPFLAEQRLESYVHLKTATNLDFVPGTIGLTLSNARDKHAVIRGRDVIVNDVGAVREYACMQVVIYIYMLASSASTPACRSVPPPPLCVRACVCVCEREKERERGYE